MASTPWIMGILRGSVSDELPCRECHSPVQSGVLQLKSNRLLRHNGVKCHYLAFQKMSEPSADLPPCKNTKDILMKHLSERQSICPLSEVGQPSPSAADCFMKAGANQVG